MLSVNCGMIAFWQKATVPNELTKGGVFKSNVVYRDVFGMLLFLTFLSKTNSKQVESVDTRTASASVSWWPTRKLRSLK